MRLQFTVVGKQPFPLDMLRYDRAFPKRQQDVDAIHQTFYHRYDGKVEVTLIGESCTVLRWNSFGYGVTENILIQKKDGAEFKPVSAAMLRDLHCFDSQNEKQMR